MTASEPSRLPDVARVLEAAEYVVESRELAGVEAILGETPYALVACVELNDWALIEEQVFDVQSALTRIAEKEPSARAWDLYVVAFVRVGSSRAADRAIAEVIEADIRYARKFVRITTAHEDLDRALRPLLPLRPPTGLEIADPLVELRDELRELNVADDVADGALVAFARSDAVEIP